jgi:hypothetical protein
MNSEHRAMGLLAAGLILIGGALTAGADLPQMLDKEWAGYFVGFRNRKFQFSVTPQGEGEIRVIGGKDEPLARRLTIPVEFVVEEISPDGKAKTRAILPESLQSAQAATDKPKQIAFQGKVRGDAGFEVFIHEDGGLISLGGRMLEPGAAAKNPLRFSIRAQIPDIYPSEKNGGDKKGIEKFEKRSENDRLLLTWTDGKKVKPAIGKPVDAGSKEINGPGIATAQVAFSAYDEKRFEFAASENSRINLSGRRVAPLHQGFFITWTADPVKDPEGKARLNLEVR